MADSTTTVRESGWKAFWDRGGWWKAVMLAAVYLALYLGTGWVVGQLWGDLIDDEDLFSDGLSVFLAVAVPVIVGSILLVAFAASVGWLPKPLFARQPVGGSWWMWVVAVLSSLIFALLHTSNLLSGQSIAIVLPTVGFTFGYGIMMYLTMRATGNLIWPIILHALTDPTTFLATGGIDVEGTNPSPLLGVAGLSTVALPA